MKTIQPLAPLGAILGLILTSGCCRVDFQTQEIRWQHNPETDAIEVVVVNRGLASAPARRRSVRRLGQKVESGSSTREEDLELARAIVEDWVNGEKRVKFSNLVDSYSLAELTSVKYLDLDPNHVPVSLEPAVHGSGAFLDERGQLSTWQHFEFPGASALIETLNEVWAHWIRFEAQATEEELESGSDELDRLQRTFELHDRESARLWLDFARNHTPWLELVDGQLRLTVPMSRAGSDAHIRPLVEQPRVSQDTTPGANLPPLSRHFRAHLIHFEVEDDRSVLTFEPTEGGPFALLFGTRDSEFDRSLQDAWQGELSPLDEDARVWSRLRATRGDAPSSDR